LKLSPFSEVRLDFTSWLFNRLLFVDRILLGSAGREGGGVTLRRNTQLLRQRLLLRWRLLKEVGRRVETIEGGRVKLEFTQPSR